MPNQKEVMETITALLFFAGLRYYQYVRHGGGDGGGRHQMTEVMQKDDYLMM